MIKYDRVKLVYYYGYSEILEYLGGTKVDDTDVSRELEKNTNSGCEDIIYDLTLQRIQTSFSCREEAYKYTLSYIANGRDSSLLIDNTPIYNVSDLQVIVNMKTETIEDDEADSLFY